MTKELPFYTNQLYALVDNKEERKALKKAGKPTGTIIPLDPNNPTAGYNLADEYNKKGYAIYWTPNSMKPHTSMKDHTDANVESLDYLFVDIDCKNPETKENYPSHQYHIVKAFKEAKLQEFKNAPIPPDIVVETRNGLQAYWTISELCPLDEIREVDIRVWKEAEARLVAFFGGDDNAMRPSNFMRYPDFNHVKNPKEPYKIEVIYNDVSIGYDTCYIRDTYPPVIEEEPQKEQSQPIEKPAYKGSSMNIEQALSYVKTCMRDYIESNYGVDATPHKKFQCIDPNHADAHPSMEFYADSNRVYCHSCGASYDIIGLIAVENGLDQKRDFIQCLKIACDFCNITLDTKQERNKTNRDSVQGANSTPEPQKPQDNVFGETVEEEESRTNYSEYFDSLPYATSDVIPYLQIRGITDSIIMKYGVRYDETCKDFNNSPAIVFPRGIYSYNARTMSNDVEKNCRYRKSTGTVDIFNFRALYGDKPIVITEGEIDALSCVVASNDRVDCIALGGATGYKKMIREINGSNYTAKDLKYPLLVCMDNDDAGRKTAQALSDELTRLQLPHFVVNLQGSHKDVNEALLNDIDTLKENINEALKDCVNYLTSQEMKSDPNFKKSLAPASDLLGDFEQQMKDIAKYGTMETGFTLLDKALDGGLRAGLYFIGAISSLGKTTFCLQIADQLALRGRDVIIFSLEQSRNELIAKSLSRQTLMKCNGDTQNAKTMLGIMNFDRYESYSRRELDLIKEAKDSYRQYGKHLHICEATSPMGIAEIREYVEKMFKYNHPLKPNGYKPVIIIDYVQIMKPYDSKMTDKLNIDMAVTGLKRISRDFNVPVIGINSFNRENYKKPVSMSSFKESGGIEYGADVLMGLQLQGVGTSNFDENDAKGDEERKVELVILKNRNGRLPKEPIKYTFHTRFNFFDERP